MVVKAQMGADRQEWPTYIRPVVHAVARLAAARIAEWDTLVGQHVGVCWAMWPGYHHPPPFSVGGKPPTLSRDKVLVQWAFV